MAFCSRQKHIFTFWLSSLAYSYYFGCLPSTGKPILLYNGNMCVFYSHSLDSWSYLYRFIWYEWPKSHYCPLISDSKKLGNKRNRRTDLLLLDRQYLYIHFGLCRVECIRIVLCDIAFYAIASRVSLLWFLQLARYLRSPKIFNLYP